MKTIRKTIPIISLLAIIILSDTDLKGVAFDLSYTN